MTAPRSPRAASQALAAVLAAAACAGEDPDLFFAHGDETAPANAAQVKAARRVCGRCPVMAGCGDYALAAGIRHGVWGALTGHERDLLRRRALPAAREGRAAA